MSESRGESIRDALFEFAEREMELALRLSDQTQQRAQTVASTLTLVISVVSVLIAARPTVFANLHNGVTKGLAIVSLALLILSLLLSLSVAFPKKIRLTHPDWFKMILEDRAAYLEADSTHDSALHQVMQRLDRTYADAYSTIMRSNRFRGAVLAISLIVLTLGLVCGVLASLRISGQL